MYAIIETGGKQYKVQQGDSLFIEKLDVQAGDAVTFDKVMVIGSEDGLKVGAPYIKGATVNATVEKNGKGAKIVVFKFKAKKNERKRQGHRQPYTKVVIGEINA